MYLLICPSFASRKFLRDVWTQMFATHTADKGWLQVCRDVEASQGERQADRIR
jgi:hypothetical protein